MLKTRTQKFLPAPGHEIAQFGQARPLVFLENDHQFVQKFVKLFVHGISKPFKTFGFTFEALLGTKIKDTRWLHVTPLINVP